jgi:hypothetical protein
MSVGVSAVRQAEKGAAQCALDDDKTRRRLLLAVHMLRCNVPSVERNVQRIEPCTQIEWFDPQCVSRSSG